MSEFFFFYEKQSSHFEMTILNFIGGIVMSKANSDHACNYNCELFAHIDKKLSDQKKYSKETC